MLNYLKALVSTPATPTPATPSPEWELIEAEQLARNKFIALEVRKEVQKQLRVHSRPAEQIRPLEHLPRVKRIKESAFGSSAGASLSSKTTLELPAREAVHQLFPSLAIDEDREDYLLGPTPSMRVISPSIPAGMTRRFPTNDSVPCPSDRVGTTSSP